MERNAGPASGVIIVEGQRKIKIEHRILDIIQKYLQTSSNDEESGGLLLGREEISSGNLIVDHCSTPLEKDERSRFRFVRRDNGHIEYYEELNISKSIYLYVGEWHTHPEGVPYFSCIDETNWKIISGDKRTPEAQYHLIAGTEAFKIWRCDSAGRNISLVCTRTWQAYKE